MPVNFEVGEFVQLKNEETLCPTRYGKKGWTVIPIGSGGVVLDKQRVSYMFGGHFTSAIRYQIDFVGLGKFWAKPTMLERGCADWGNIEICNTCVKRFRCFTTNARRKKVCQSQG